MNIQFKYCIALVSSLMAFSAVSSCMLSHKEPIHLDCEKILEAPDNPYNTNYNHCEQRKKFYDNTKELIALQKEMESYIDQAARDFVTKYGQNCLCSGDYNAIFESAQYNAFIQKAKDLRKNWQSIKFELVQEYTLSISQLYQQTDPYLIHQVNLDAFFKKVIQSGVNVNCTNSYGYSLLFMASHGVGKRYSSNFVSYLLDANVDINKQPLFTSNKYYYLLKLKGAPVYPYVKRNCQYPGNEQCNYKTPADLIEKELDDEENGVVLDQTTFDSCLSCDACSLDTPNCCAACVSMHRIASANFFRAYDRKQSGIDEQSLYKIEDPLKPIPDISTLPQPEADPDYYKLVYSDNEQKDYLKKLENSAPKSLYDVYFQFFINNCETTVMTPLLYAIRHTYDKYDNKPGAIEQIIKSGADVNLPTLPDDDFTQELDEPARDFYSYELLTPLDYAIMYSDVATVKLLVDAGAKMKDNENPIFLAAAHNRLDMIDLFLERGTDINSKDHAGKTILHYLVNPSFDLSSEYCKKRIEEIKTKGKNVEMEEDEDLNKCQGVPQPIYECIDTAKVIQKYVKAGSNVNATDNEGKTPLHYAVNKSAKLKTPAAKILIKLGADLKIKDADGKTPADYTK